MPRGATGLLFSKRRLLWEHAAMKKYRGVSVFALLIVYYTIVYYIIIVYYVIDGESG